MGIYNLTFDVLGRFGGEIPKLNIYYGGKKLAVKYAYSSNTPVSLEIDTDGFAYNHSLLRFYFVKGSGADGDSIEVSNIKLDNDALDINNFEEAKGGTVTNDSLVLGKGEYIDYNAQASGDITDTQYVAPQSGAKVQAVITGTAGDDRPLYGTNEAGGDVIDALAGDDKVIAADGNDTVNAGDGNDYVSGGNGDDILNGNAGNDKMYGGNGDDTLNGGTGTDKLYGNAGNDTINGGDDNDTLYGNEGQDTLDGGNGDDNISGGADNDTLYAGAGNDQLFGGDGDDEMYGGNDNDRMLGNAGNDTMYGDAGDDNIDGQEGDDTIYGGSGSDTIDGEEGNDTLLGDGGDDYIIGGQGADILTGGAGNDVMYGGGISSYDQYVVRNTSAYGTSELFFLEQTQSFYTFVQTNLTWNAARSDANNTLLNGAEGHLVNITSSVENDFIYNLGLSKGASSTNRIWLGGNDVAVDQKWVWADGIESGIQFSQAGNGINNFYDNWGSGQPNNVGGSQEYATFWYNGGDTWDDRPTGDSHYYVIEWAADDVIADNSIDILNGGVGNDTLYGGGGNDVLNGGNDNDILFGQDGNDSLFGDVGNDSLIGGAGNDIIDGGAGIDTAILSGNEADYTITLSGAIYTFVHNSGLDGTDTFTLVENFAFADGEVAVGDLNINTGLVGTAGDDIIYSDSTPAGRNSYIQDVLDNNATPITGQNGTQALMYNADTGNFYQYVVQYVSESQMNNNISGATIDGVAGTLVSFENADELSYVLNNLGADYGGAPAFQNNTVVADTNAGDGLLTTLNADGSFGTSSGYVPYIVEWDGDAILGPNNTPGTGTSQTLSGGDGADNLYGADGQDTFIFEAAYLDHNDTVHDFDVDHGDVLDISDILSDQGIAVNAGNISSYISLDQWNGLRVDTSGSGQFYNSNNNIVTTFSGTTDLDDLSTMYTNGNLIV